MILCPFCTPHLWYRYKRLVELCIRSYFNFIHKISILLLAASQPYNIVEFLKILKLPSFYSGDFKLFKNALGQFITHRPSKHVITSNGIRTRNHLVCQRAINHLAKLTKWLWALICTVHLTVRSYHATYEFQGKSTLYILPKCQRTPCSKQARYLQIVELCCNYLSVWCIWLYVIIMPRTSFRVNLHSILVPLRFGFSLTQK